MRNYQELIFKTLTFCLLFFVGGCNKQLLSKNEKGWFGQSTEKTISGANLLKVQWTRRLGGHEENSFIPIETAAPSYDPHSKTVWIGSASGFLYHINRSGRILSRVNEQGPVESKVSLHPDHPVLFGATAEGSVFCYDTLKKKFLWKQDIHQPVRVAPLLNQDVMFVFTDHDQLFAMSQKEGKILWQYERPLPEGFTVTGHAGLTIEGNRIFTGFSDGLIMAFDISDGSTLWEKDTAVDAVDPATGEKKWIDVDTVPVIKEDRVFAASFTGGFYALSKETGEVILHIPQLKGITHISLSDECMLLSSASEGLICFDLEAQNKKWIRTFSRGTPGEAIAFGDKVFVAESQGDFLMLSIKSGQELARISTSHGFLSSPVLVDDHQGLILSNGGTLFSFGF